MINFVASSVNKMLKYTFYIRTLSSAMQYLWQLRYTIVERNHLKAIVIFGNCVCCRLIFYWLLLATYAETGCEAGLERTDFDAH